MRLLVGICVVVLMASAAVALDDRDRDVNATTTCSLLTTVQPENPPSGWTCTGWDTTPTSGHWGGRDESQFAVVWEPGTPDQFFDTGRLATCTYNNTSTKKPVKIEMEVLEGQANDDFWVLITTGAGDLLVYAYNESYGGEQWKKLSFNLPPNVLAAGQDVTIKILVTGNAWSGFNTYGQLAVDYIKIYEN